MTDTPQPNAQLVHPLHFHPLANWFPLIEGEEFSRRVVEDIRTRGLMNPIILYQGKIIDGRNRYRAAAGSLAMPSLMIGTSNT